MDVVYCTCGKEAAIKTSRTSRNPGRRFYSCPQKESQCKGFIGWVNDRPEDMLPGLLRALNVLEDSNEKLQSAKDEFEAKFNETQAELKKYKKYKKCLTITWIILAGILVGKWLI